jgi:serine/threonine protein kinase
MNATAENRNEPEAALEVGQLLEGKYRVDHLVGQGGMAAVWAGTNERTGKRVALKVLLRSFAAVPGIDALFQRESLAASRVNHPNVVTVFDVIEHQGMACIVMELLTGEPLDRYVGHHGPLSVSDACGLLLPAMRGVAAAHAQGVIHRDVKPQNIFVCIGPDGRAVTTKVLDFGISLIVERAREPCPRPSSSIPMGTPVYMAPEQIAATGAIGERTDVYGFGVLYYEVLTGRVPFPEEPGLSLYESILYDPPPPLAQFRSDLPPGLVRIIETAMSKDPFHRFASLNEMLTALESELPLASPPLRPLTPSTGVPITVVAGGTAGRAVTTVEASQPTVRRDEHLARSLRHDSPLGGNARREVRAGAVFGKLLRTWSVLVDMGASVAHAPWRPWRSLRRSHHVQAWTGISLVPLIAGGVLTWLVLVSDPRPSPTSLTPSMVQTASSTPRTSARVVVEPLTRTRLDERAADPKSPPTDDLRAPAATFARARLAQDAHDVLLTRPLPVGLDMAKRSPDKGEGIHRTRGRALPARPSASLTPPGTRPRAGDLSDSDF